MGKAAETSAVLRESNGRQSMRSATDTKTKHTPSAANSNVEQMEQTQTTAAAAQSIDIEVRLRPDAKQQEQRAVESLVTDYLLHEHDVECNTAVCFESSAADYARLSPSPQTQLAQIVDRLLITEWGVEDGQLISVCAERLRSAHFYLYRVSGNSEPTAHVLDVGGGEDEEPVVGSHQWEIPNEQFDQFWSSLVFDQDIKTDTLKYMNAVMLLSDQNVNTSVVCVNRLMLFHGPPGTGKTTLCKGLAQRLCVRMMHRFKRAVLVEVNSHSLFSKWFSESGKLVSQLFAQIHSLMDDPECLVCVLIDEVESLTMAREQSMARNEPSDAVRVVNALLTQIDSIRQCANVLVLATSNLSDAVDPAFVDRADIKRLIPPPSANAIYTIYCSMITELQRTGVLSAAVRLPCRPNAGHGMAALNLQANNAHALQLLNIALKSVGLSGRALRKLPVLAYAQLLQKGVSMADFLRALDWAVDQELQHRTEMCTKK